MDKFRDSKLIVYCIGKISFYKINFMLIHKGRHILRKKGNWLKGFFDQLLKMHEKFLYEMDLKKSHKSLLITTHFFDCGKFNGQIISLQSFILKLSGMSIKISRLCIFVKEVDPRKMQINLTGFLNGKNARTFMSELWEHLNSAQNSENGIPQELVNIKVNFFEYQGIIFIILLKTITRKESFSHIFIWHKRKIKH